MNTMQCAEICSQFFGLGGREVVECLVEPSVLSGHALGLLFHLLELLLELFVLFGVACGEGCVHLGAQFGGLLLEFLEFLFYGFPLTWNETVSLEFI